MDFHYAQDKARSNTWKFALLILGSVALTPLLLGLLIATGLLATGDGTDFISNVAIITMLSCIVIYPVILTASVIQYFRFNKAGPEVAKMLGGIEIVEADIEVHDRKKVMNVIEEIALAASLPLPEVFILPSDEINAFAAGKDAGQAVIGLTKGSIHKLNRAELQAVIAHEYGHIVNEDVRVNARISGVVGGLLVIYYMGWLSLRYGTGGSPKLRNMVWGLALMLTGLVTWMAGKIIQAAVSREREYLADATSIQYTREPEALANALRKKALENKAQEKPDQAQMAFNKRKEACAHMFFFNVSEIFTSGPLATHPTIEKRLEAILDREVNLEDELKKMPALQGKLHPTQLT